MKLNRTYPAIIVGLLAAMLLPIHVLSLNNNPAFFLAKQPCRLFDTRQVGGKFSPGETRDFFAFETAGEIAGQGGLEGGCAIGQNTTAVFVVFSAVSPDSNGWVRAWDADELEEPNPEPNATILNFVGGQNISGGVPVPICANENCVAEFQVKVYAGSTHLVGDVVGVFEEAPIAP